jgi:two-component system, response regulator PdtaR
VKTVLVVDDDAAIRQTLERILTYHRHRVLSAPSGPEALRQVMAEAVDAILLDIKMPGMDGISAAREIGAERLSAVVLVTAFSQRELIEEASDAGVHGYVVKPFERHDLTPAIEVAIARFGTERELAEQVTDVTERLETRKILDRAKGVLMDQHGLSEQASFDFVQKRAMSERATMREIAEQVLAGTLRPEA